MKHIVPVSPEEKAIIIKETRLWVERVVIDLNLCPFAKRELIRNRVRFNLSQAQSEESLLQDLHTELELLNNDSSIETTLLVHPFVLNDFYDYNQFLNLSDALLDQLRFDGIFQIASFHPDYQFAGTEADDAENYTNRSPYPMLHLIREESLERAISNYPDTDQIPERNIMLMKQLGRTKIETLLQSCKDDAQSQKDHS